MSLTTYQVRKVCKCNDCGSVFDINAEIENEDIVCAVETCQSQNIVVVGSKVRKNTKLKRKNN